MATGLQPKHLTGLNASFTSDLAIVPVKLRSLNKSMFDTLFESSNSRAIGIAGEYLDSLKSPNSLALTAIAFATASLVLVIEIGSKELDDDILDTDSEDGSDSDECDITFQEALASALRGDDHILLAFNADRLALSLYDTLGQRISNLVDLQASVPSTNELPRNAPKAIIGLLGGTDNVDSRLVHGLFANERHHQTSFHKLAFRALSAFIAQYHNDLDEKMEQSPKIDTTSLKEQILDVTCKIYNDNSLLESMKPAYALTYVGEEVEVEDSIITILATQYKDRFRKGSRQEVLIRVRGLRYPYKATVDSVKGKTVKLRLTREIPDRSLNIVSIALLGPEDPTLAVAVKEEAILHILQGRDEILSTPLFQCIWFNMSPGKVVPPNPEFLNEFTAGMNEKQREALKIMLSESETAQLPIIIGPPGTGKTTVISAFTRALAASRCPVWVVAQSNVGVKNIASRLMKDQFMDWRLLVSKDFYHEWNEDLYRDIPGVNKIITDDFQRSQTSRQLNGVRVILCTLNLLVNPKLRSCGFVHEVPLRILVVDEASQIEASSYLPVLARHGAIEKICFFGDDKQLAPFGAEQISNLASIFEIPHLRAPAIFLDTQYRVPAGIARFISQEVYDQGLKSMHSNNLRSACQFINVVGGREEYFKTSYRNDLEVKAVKQLVKVSTAMNLDFRVITPYEGQRARVESMLKTSELPYEDRVFNVDSFQGNEADIIIITLVRTDKVGFLGNLRRINVMLTRCKVAMFIVCKLDFLRTTQACDTLVGKMAAEWCEAGETIVNLADAKPVQWSKLFSSLKYNTWGRASVPKNKKAARKNNKIDFIKIGYGSVLRKPPRIDNRVGSQWARSRKEDSAPNGNEKHQRRARKINIPDEWSTPDGWAGEGEGSGSAWWEQEEARVADLKNDIIPDWGDEWVVDNDEW